MSTARPWLIAAMCLAVPAATAGAAERVELTVDMAGVDLAAPHPVRAGVPFAKGTVPAPTNARVLAGGKEIDAQARALAYWPDGSVKWLLLDFSARAGAKVTVEYGKDVKRRPVARGIKAAKSPAAVTLDSGAIRLTVRKNGTAFIDELAFDKNGDGTYDAGETIVAPAAEGERRHVLDFLHRPPNAHYPTLGSFVPGATVGRSTVEITELPLEEDGPLHSVVLIRGTHNVPKLSARIADEIKGEGRCAFTMRLHLYRDLPAVEGEAHFVYDGVGDDDFVKAWGVRLPVGKGLTFTTPTDAGLATIRPDDDDAPFAALTQASADGFRVWRADGDRMGEAVVARGTRSAGWVDLGGKDWGVTVGTRWFWRRWPNAIHYDAAAGAASIMLYPPEALPMDMRRYARREWGVGETYAPESPPEYFASFASRGAANTKQFRLLFRRGPADAGEIAKRFGVFERPPLAKAPPAHYSATRALGYYAPRVEGRRDRWERAVDATLTRRREAQAASRWYGMWDYGDYQQRFGDPGNVSTHRYGRWENDWGRWGWGGGDGHGRVGRALLMTYFRTGDRGHFDQGEAHVRHRNDSDIRETREFPWSFSPMRKIPSDRTAGPWWDISGCASRHGVQHWSGPYIGARGGNPLGQRLHYYLTGNGRTGDILNLIAEMGMVRCGWDGRKKVAQRLGNSGSDGMAAACLQGVLIKWERTGQAKYGEMLKAAIRPGSEVWPRLKRGDNWAAGYFIPFGGTQAIQEYYDLTKDDQARTIILAAARQLIGARRSWSWPAPQQQLVAGALRLSGDEQLKKLAEEMIELQIKKGAGFNVIDYMPYQFETLDLLSRKGGN